MQQGNITSINWNAGNLFAYIKDDNIYNAYTNEPVGVSLSKYKEVEQGLIKCKDKLIELGVIEVPKTQEQILKEQSTLIAKQTQMIDKLMEKLNESRTHSEDTSILTREDENTNQTEPRQSLADDRPITSELNGRCAGNDKQVKHTKRSSK